MMETQNSVAILSELLVLEQGSLTRRLLESTLFVSHVAVDDLNLVKRLAAASEQACGQLANLILKYDSGLPYPAGNMTSGDLHFLELRHVMPRLAADEQRLVAAYAAAADRLNDDEPEVSGAVTRILARHREHLDALQTVAGAGAPS